MPRVRGLGATVLDATTPDSRQEPLSEVSRHESVDDWVDATAQVCTRFSHFVSIKMIENSFISTKRSYTKHALANLEVISFSKGVFKRVPHT